MLVCFVGLSLVVRLFRVWGGDLASRRVGDDVVGPRLVPQTNPGTLNGCCCDILAHLSQSPLVLSYPTSHPSVHLR